MTLADYLRSAACRDYGVVPCAEFAAGWVVEKGRPDPLAFMRQDSERAAMRRLASLGGVLGLAQRGMAEAGVPEVSEPELGDVGVIERPTEDGYDHACAIYGGERWVTLTPGGFTSAPARALMIWRP